MVIELLDFAKVRMMVKLMKIVLESKDVFQKAVKNCGKNKAHVAAHTSNICIVVRVNTPKKTTTEPVVKT